MTDLRSAIRSLSTTPLVTLVAILSLALGVGANTAIFSIVDTLLLRALPVAHAERLVVVREGESRGSWTNPIWEEIRARPELFDGAFAAGRASFNAAASGEVDPVDGLFASGDYFDVLGVPALLGRTFAPEDDQRGGGPDGPVAVISYAFWQNRFGGAADVVGRTLMLSRVAYTIIGVTPSAFFGHEVGRTVDVFVPLGTEPVMRGAESTLDRRSTWWMAIFARLKPGQSAEQATTALRTAQEAIREATLPPDWQPQHLESYLKNPLSMVPAASGVSGLRTRYRTPLLALTAVVALTLLIACGNIANLMLARTSARRHEFAIRTALGASRWRLSRQLLTENLLLSVIGALLGLLLAIWGSRLIVAQIANSTNRVFLDIGLDWRVLGFTALIAIATTLIFGIAPTLFATRVPPMESLKDQGRGSVSRKQVGLAGSLVLAQVALSLVLLVAAGLFVQTFITLADRELGFTPEQALVIDVGAQRTDVQPENRYALYERVREAVSAVPGVTNAAMSVITPTSGSTWNSLLEFPDRPELSEDDRVVDLNYLSPGWFATLGTPLIAGRDFDSRDRVGAGRTAMVNRQFAEKYFNGESPIGKTVRWPEWPGRQGYAVEIVGLVGDAVYRNLREPLGPTLYMAMAQDSTVSSSIVLTVRTSNATPVQLTRSLTAAITGVHPDLSLTIRPLDEFVDATLSQERLIAMLSGFFGVLALLLAALGLYGITAYAVTRRRAELGIRMALGASPPAVVRLVLSRTSRLVAGGLLVGGVLSWWASRFVASLLFGLEAADPSTIAGAMLVLALVAVVAGWIPARRAARVDPAEALRQG